MATRLLFDEPPPQRARQSLELLVGFEADDMADGTVSAGNLRLLRPSKYLSEEGSWEATEAEDVEMPALRCVWRLRTISSGLALDFIDGGYLPKDILLEFDAPLTADERAGRVAALLDGAAASDDGAAARASGLCMRDGRIRLQLASQLSLALGVAEYQTIGTFTARPM